MSRLRHHDDDGSADCVECRSRLAVGPCAACEGMVCGDCCTLVTDPGGKRVICLSCARMVADIDRKALVRRTPGSKSTAYLILAVLAIGLAAAFLRGFLDD